MSFGWSGSDVFLLTRLAWKIFKNSRKACGEYDNLTRETLRSHAVLQRLAQEVAKQESPINRPGETSKEQLERIVIDCEVILTKLDRIVTAYASLGKEKRSVQKIWQEVRFGNGQLVNLREIRSKLKSYTSEIILYLNLVSTSTVGRTEQRMCRGGGVLRDIQIAVEKTTAHTTLGGNKEGSVWTSYTDDDPGFWRGLRRDLIRYGLPSAAINKHKHLIEDYVRELGAPGILDAGFPAMFDQGNHHDLSSQSDRSSEDISRNRYLHDWLHSRSEVHRSKTTQLPLEAKNYSKGRFETMPVDRRRPGNPVPLNSSTREYPKAPSDISDSSSESGSEISKENYSFSVSKLLARFIFRTAKEIRKRPRLRIPFLNLSNRNYPKATSYTSDSSSESDSEIIEENYLLPRPNPLARLTFRTAQEEDQKRPEFWVPLKSSNRTYRKAPSDTSNSDSSSESDSEVSETSLDSSDSDSSSESGSEISETSLDASESDNSRESDSEIYDEDLLPKTRDPLTSFLESLMQGHI